MSNVVPLFRHARDGRRILRDLSRSANFEQYARQPDARTVNLTLPNELIERIDALANAELLSRATWIRRQIAIAARVADIAQETAPRRVLP
jgi:hypothetical protein